MPEVQRVLAEIGAADVPQILVYNKLDRMEETERPRVLADMAELPGGARVPRVFVSALQRRRARRCCAQRIAELAAPRRAGLNAAAPSRICATPIRRAERIPAGDGDERRPHRHLSFARLKSAFVATVFST